MAAGNASADELAADLGLSSREATELLEQLSEEGFLVREGDAWRVA